MLSRQVLRFGFVGAVGFATNAGLLEIGRHLLGPIVAQLIAFPSAATVTWWLNRRYTFASSRSWQREWLLYMAANAVGWGVTNGLYVALVLGSRSFYERPLIALAIGAAAGLVFNFAISKWVVFKPSP